MKHQRYLVIVFFVLFVLAQFVQGGDGTIPGDECSTALEAVEGPNPFDSTYMTPSDPQPDDSTCVDTYLDWDNSNDAWLYWVAPDDGAVTFSTCDSDSYDTSMVLYEGSCENQVACNGDGDEDVACQEWYSKIIDYPVTAGETYYIRLGGWEGATGIGTLTITRIAGDLIRACCMEDGSCMDLTFDQCQNSSGSWSSTDVCGDIYCPASYCNSGIGPDIMVGDLQEILKYGIVGDITSYSVATNVVNIGDEEMPWVAATNQHPVIAQHMYRMNDKRIEQIGISWVKHGFGSLTLDLFNCGCVDPGNFEMIGVGCSDPYTAGLNGDQVGFGGIAGLGPRSEVDAALGIFSFPYGSQGQSGDLIYKRLQVKTNDLDPIFNQNAQYFVEGQYVTPHDAQAGNGANSVAHRPVQPTTFNNGWNLQFAGDTVPGLPAIYAWQAAYPDVELTQFHTGPSPYYGTMVLATRVTETETGWHYEYALHNINSDLCAGSFGLEQIGDDVTNQYFHKALSHSGEPYSNDPWTFNLKSGGLLVHTETYEENENANALRWGTMLNVAFDSDLPPASGQVVVGLFKPDLQNTIFVEARVPTDVGIECIGDINADGFVNVTDLLAAIDQWGPCKKCSADINGDAVVDVTDLLEIIGAWGPCL
jgi:hypothetical protein|tara:strand:+ start:628 stop:2568 length:1941 start_codon:yes stop_codon:yes gene_type:complete